MAIVVNVNDAGVAAENTLEINALIAAASAVGGSFQLPAGTIYLSTGLDLSLGNFTMLGSGNLDTILYNGFFSATYPANCSVFATGNPQAGFNDSILLIEYDTNTVTLSTGTISNFEVGKVVYLSIYDSYFSGHGTTYGRFTIKSVNVAHNSFQTNETITNVGYNRAFWTNGYAIDYASKTSSIRLIDKNNAAHLTIGMRVAVSNGSAVANELLNEHTTVLNVNTVTGEIELNNILNWSYDKGAIILDTSRTENLVLRNITIKQPIHSGSNPIFCDFLNNCLFENVKFGTTFSNSAAFGNSQNVYFDNIQSVAPLSMNDCTNFAVVNSVVNGIITEERCYKLKVYNTDIIGYPDNDVQHGIVSSTGSSTFDICNVTISHYGFGGYSPLAGSFANSQFNNVSIINSNSVDIGSFISGDRMRMVKVDADSQIFYQSGLNAFIMGLSTSRLVLGYENGTYRTTGTLISDCNVYLYPNSEWDQQDYPSGLSLNTLPVPVFDFDQVKSGVYVP